VLVQAAQARETGRPAPPASRVAGEFTPEHGLGKWVGQAWEMVIGEVWAWVGALVLMALIGGVTFGIAGAATDGRALRDGAEALPWGWEGDPGR
jgi:hypothetical protein